MNVLHIFWLMPLAAFITWTWVCFPEWFRMPAALTPATPQDEIVGLVVLTIKNDPDGWTKTNHHWTHKGLGFSIWVANSDYGLDLSTNHKPAMSSNTLPLTSRQRKLIWGALEQPMARHKDQAERDNAEEIILRVMSYYERERERVS